VQDSNARAVPEISVNTKFYECSRGMAAVPVGEALLGNDSGDATAFARVRHLPQACRRCSHASAGEPPSCFDAENTGNADAAAA
jgi:hypothetical protein